MTGGMGAIAWAAAAALVTACTLWAWLRWGRWLPLDVPNGRSLHAGVVPRIGGVAMAPAGALALAGLSFQPPAAALAIAGAAGLLFVLSLADDWHSLPVAPRLAGHLAAALAAWVALDLPLSLAVPGVLALVWMTNLYNFMDGADGLAGSMAVVGFGAYGVAAQTAGLPWAWACFALAGAAAGFLAFNFPPARVFLGDAGSVPLGFLAGALGLAGWQAHAWPAWFPLLVFSPFIADASATLAGRLLRGERVWQAHRDHCYQQLVRMGWSHRRLAAAAFVLMLAAGASAIAMRHWTPTVQTLGLLCWTVVYAVVLRAVRVQWGKNGELPVIPGG